LLFSAFPDGLFTILTIYGIFFKEPGGIHGFQFNALPQKGPKLSPMQDNLDMLFDEKTIENRVKELAQQISRDYVGKNLVLICVLKGAYTFTADLMRELTIPAAVEFVRAASYGCSTEPAKDVAIRQDVGDIANRHVLLVDTIIDTGRTLACLLKMFSARGPASLGAVALLNKKARRTKEVKVTYCGFDIPDQFVVGYGLDFAERYRNLPYVAVLDPADQ
jgi:hypoxanthine phosphoribosyltransferase